MSAPLTAAGLAVLPCDFCRDPVAPFGFAPPPRSGIAVRRPIKTCGDPACNAQAEARVADLMARHDPLAAARRQNGNLKENQQGSLF
jgi:hypothetical protein